MKPSDIYFFGTIAAEANLPEASRTLIKNLDSLNRQWAKDKWPHPMPDALKAASEAVRRDPLANAAMAIRALGNEAAAQEYRDKQ